MTKNNIAVLGIDRIPWCAVEASIAARDAGFTQFWTARAWNFTQSRDCIVYDLKKVTGIIPQPGDFLVKGRPGGNHVDIVLAAFVDERGVIWVEVRGGNVGDKVATRLVRLRQPGNKFWYSHLVRANE